MDEFVQENYVHILNGDALKSRFPYTLQGEVIVMRECFIEGSAIGNNLDEVFAHRAEYLSKYTADGDYYYEHVVSEFNKMMSLNQQHHVVCWFEDDLFCQTNFWFVVYLLVKHAQIKSCCLVRPNKGNEYSFANMTDHELEQVFENKILLSKPALHRLAELWPNYQNKQLDILVKIGNDFSNLLPFLSAAVEAEIDRLPDQDGLGKPERLLLNLMLENPTLGFVDIFSLFAQQTQIYSFGDVQVRSMFDKLLAQIHSN